jgi:thymidylate synthase
MPLNIIVAFTHKTFAIGRSGGLPWNIPQDLLHFREVTKQSIVVMGRKTYYSIPETSRPLKNRWNVVLTSDVEKGKSGQSEKSIGNLQFLGHDELDEFIDLNMDKQIFVCGGEALYKMYMSKADTIYATVIEKEYPGCDTFFPISNFQDFEIATYSEPHFSAEEQCQFRFISYKKSTSKHGEHVYLDLMQDILLTGGQNTPRPDRTGVGTYSVFARQLRFDISKSVPFLTTKLLAWKTVTKELLWFLKGQTDSKILEKQGVHIWKPNTTREFLDNRGLHDYKEGDTGPLYSTSFRAFGCDYKGCEHDHLGEGYDQLSNLIKGLKEDPYSRRHLMTTFNPALVSKCVLAPCHGIAIQFYVNDDVDPDVKHLSCHVYCRSSDTFLGLSFNIASYSIFTYIIAKLCDMKPKELIVSTGDTHIYSNHLEQVLLQLSRDPLPFPVLEVSDTIKDKKIEDITMDDFSLVGYLHHPSIKADMAV